MGSEVKSIKDIFIRRQKFLSEYEELKRNPRKDQNMIQQEEIQNEINSKLNDQLKYEIDNFKETKESDLINILKKFVDVKLQATIDVTIFLIP